jgi:DNA-binding IscR family transcriptional regulator
MPTTTWQKPLTKAARVKKLLSRGKGVTLGEISRATEWQPHSVRSFLSGLRKTGADLVKEQRGSGGTAYRIIAAGKERTVVSVESIADTPIEMTS